MDAPELVVFLGWLQERTRTGLGQARQVLAELALEPHVFADLPYSRVQSAYSVANQAGLSQISSMFLSSVLEVNPTIEQAFKGNDHLGSACRNPKKCCKKSGPIQVRSSHARPRPSGHRHLAEQSPDRRTRCGPNRGHATDPTRSAGSHRGPFQMGQSLPGEKSTGVQSAYTEPNRHRRLLPTLLKQDLRVAIESGVLGKEMGAEARMLHSRRLSINLRRRLLRFPSFLVQMKRLGSHLWPFEPSQDPTPSCLL